MRGRGIEVVVALLHILAVVAFRAGQAKETLFQDRIFSIPQGQRKTEPAFPVGNTQQAILTPAIGPAAGLFMREVFPGSASCE